eukprot:m.179571 g.179571  ORF g.179571 m.179571 type:complete len:398 (-) comp14798_c0_seq1:171-1364(-)
MMETAGGQVVDALGPARKKLTSLEAERVATVIDDLIEKINLLHLAFLSNETTDKTLGLPEPVKAALDEFRAAESVFLVTDGDAAGAAVADATRSLARAMRAYPDQSDTVVDALKAAVPGSGPMAQRAQSLDLFLAQLQDLRDVLFEKLLTTVDEERGRQEHLAKLVKNQQSLKKEIAELSSIKAESEAERDRLIKQRTDVIQKITTELYRITTQGDTVYSRITEQGVKAEADKTAAANTQMEALTAEAEALEKKLEDLRQAHADEESKIRKSKFKMEADVAGWISKYDEEMARKQELIDEETTAHETEKRQMAELESKFESLQEEYDAIMEEKRISRERYDAHNHDQAARNHAASVIQKRWSAYQEEKKANSKGKGKKGSGKKGSKKKSKGKKKSKK